MRNLTSAETILMAWLRKLYRHDACGVSWTDEWSCACNDRCPLCEAEIEPYDFVDLSVLVEPGENRRRWTVRVSPPIAEDAPRYVETCFDREKGARAFAEHERRRLDERVD